MKTGLLAGLLLLLIRGPVLAQNSDPNNGLIDGLDELVSRQEYMFRMHDSVGLASDVFLPVLQDDLAVADIEIPLPIPGVDNLTIPRLKMADKGVQFMQFPDQDDPYRLPVLFTRTPYSKKDPTTGQIYALMGYCGVVQDMRGRDASEGTYYPMYSDSWAKEAYLGDFAHPLDTTADHAASRHQDGHESLRYILDELRVDSDGDGQLTENDRLVCNGSIGMFGASALGNTQYQAAAVEYTDTDQPGLKCMLPIVASCEFYHCTATQNGVYRERIIDGWLRGQVERYNYTAHADNTSVWDDKHSLGDYGPPSVITSGRDVAETAIDFWTTMGRAHYPDADFRAVMDVSRARIDENGNPDPNGAYSRYRNLDMPIYNLTGWWDIFTDGQIQTWQLLRKHIAKHRGHQKLIIGPWAHQTIGSRATGDMRESENGDHRYPDNVGNIIGASLDNVSEDNLSGLSQSEIIDFFRGFMGSPTVVLPALDEWQPIGQVLGQDVFIKVPAEEYSITFEEFFNFLNGSGPLADIPISVRGLQIVDSSDVNRITIPATGQSLIGDQSGAQLSPPGTTEWDDTKGGVPAVRFYVPGPVADDNPANEGVGNYWYAADTFPLPNLPVQSLYLHGDSTLSTEAPEAEEPPIRYFSDPNNPVPTHGGGNMIVRTPDDERESQGQMDFNDPQFRNVVLDRPTQVIEDESLSDLVSFTSPPLADTFSTSGFPVTTLFARARPLSSLAPDETNCDFIVRVLDVYPDGREMYVFEGVVNARARNYAESWADGQEDDSIPFSNIASDSLYRYRFRMMPIAYTWGVDHKIKVLISGTNYPRYQACPNLPLEDGEFFRRRPYEDKTYTYEGQALYPRRSLQTLVFSDIHDARIEFPYMGSPMRFQTTDRETVAEQEALPKVWVYPNPATDIVSISMDRAGSYQATLRTMMGQEMTRQHFDQNTALIVDTLPRGLYLLTIDNGETQVTKKVVLR